MVGGLSAPVTDSEWVIHSYLTANAIVTMGLGSYWMSQLTLDVSPWQVVWSRVVIIAGLSMTFAPLNVAALRYFIHPGLCGARVALPCSSACCDRAHSAANPLPQLLGISFDG